MKLNIRSNTIMILLFVMTFGTNAAIAVKDNTERKISLWGHVKDSFTNGGIKDVMITLMDADSCVVDTQKVRYFDEDKTYMDSYYEFKIPAVPRQYIIKAEHPDYSPCYVDFNVRYVARNTFFDAPFHYMTRKPKMKSGGDLAEVVVKATKVRMVFRKDTVTYYADAFNLPNGSMLDELVRQLPGVRLGDDGEIFLNGKKVESLLLHGDDFFKHDKNIVLRNLPSYTVRKIDFYDKADKRSEYLGRDVTERKLVMDVQLRKEYSRSYVANAEGGYGTHERYMGRLFGLRFTPHSRFSLYGNTNNTNSYLRPGSDGEWMESNLNSGRLATKSAGMELMLKNRDETVTNRLTANADWRDNDLDTRKIASTFLPSGNNTTESLLSSRSNGLFSFVSNSLEFMGPVYVNSYTGWIYIKSDGISSDVSSTLADSMHINTMEKYNLGKGYRSTLWETLSATRKLPWGDNIDLAVTLRYEKSNNRSFDNYNVLYHLSSASDIQEQYSDAPTEDYRVNSTAAYNLSLLSGWNFNLEYQLTQSYRREQSSRYRLDWLAGWPDGNHAIGELPSTRDSMLLALSPDNSYKAWHHNTENGVALRTSWVKERGNTKSRLDIALPLLSRHERLHYMRGETDTVGRRTNWLFQPSAKWSLTKDRGMELAIHYNATTTTPEMKSTMGYTDTTAPLAIVKGNSSLRNTVSHDAGLEYRNRIARLKMQYGFTANVVVDRNLIANTITYDGATGVYTFQPQNINGNWRATIGNTLSLSLGSSQMWFLDNNVNFTYNRNVDFVTMSETDMSVRNKVDNLYLAEKIRLTMQKGKFRGSAVGNVDWHKASNGMELSSSVDVVDFSYGLTATYTLPWNVNIATDMKMYSRRGYEWNGANTDYLIWNMSLSRSFLKNALSVRLTGYDMLRKVSTHTFEVNGQGRTEVFTNSIPNYFMLCLGYKINARP